MSSQSAAPEANLAQLTGIDVAGEVQGTPDVAEGETRPRGPRDDETLVVRMLMSHPTVI